MNQCKLDEHWRPFIAQCAFCDIPYKVIARAETFAEDQKFIGQMAGVTFEQIETHQSRGGSSKELAKIYFGQLDRRTVNKLFRLYKVDFQMFGYSPDLYLGYAREN